MNAKEGQLEVCVIDMLRSRNQILISSAIFFFEYTLQQFE